MNKIKAQGYRFPKIGLHIGAAFEEIRQQRRRKWSTSRPRGVQDIETRKMNSNA